MDSPFSAPSLSQPSAAASSSSSRPPPASSSFYGSQNKQAQQEQQYQLYHQHQHQHQHQSLAQPTSRPVLPTHPQQVQVPLIHPHLTLQDTSASSSFTRPSSSSQYQPPGIFSSWDSSAEQQHPATTPYLLTPPARPAHPYWPSPSSSSASTPPAPPNHHLRTSTSPSLLNLNSRSPAANDSTTSGKAEKGGGKKKETLAAAAKDSSQPYLKKQQACLTCKRRKTRCDAARPVCGACGRSQRRSARGHGLTADVPPGDCQYPDEGGTSSPTAATPTDQCPQAATVQSGPSSDFASTFHSMRQPTALTDAARSMRTAGSLSSMFTAGSSPDTMTPTPTTSNTAFGDDKSAHDVRGDRIMLEVQSSSGKPTRIRRFYQSADPDGEYPQMSASNLLDRTLAEVPLSIDAGSQAEGEPAAREVDEEGLPRVDLMLRQLLPDVTPDLPTPDTIHHMARIFLAKHPLRNMFCKRRMLARFRLPPNHPFRPHPSLIHATLALAEPFSPLLAFMRDHNPLSGAADQDDPPLSLNASKEPDFYSHPSPPSCGPVLPDFSKTADAVEANGRGIVGFVHPLEVSRPAIWKESKLSFGEFHLAKARRELEVAVLTSSKRPLEWLQAAIMVTYGLADRCRNMECLWLSTCASRGISLATFSRMPNDRMDPRYRRGVMPPPDTSISDYEQRMAFWQVYLADVYGGGAARTYEPFFCDEKNQLTTTLPVRMDDVEDDTLLVYSTQTLASPDLYRVGHTDSFSLHVKSASLLKRARLFASRRGPELNRMARPSKEVREINTDITEFLTTFPNRAGIDPDWIVAEANVCMTIITIHALFVDATQLDPISFQGRGLIERASKIILDTIHYLLNSSYDFSMLHVQTYVAWIFLIRVLSDKLAILQRQSASKRSLQKAPHQPSSLSSMLAATESSIDSVLGALRKAAEKNWRAQNCLDIWKTAQESELSEDEFT